MSDWTRLLIGLAAVMLFLCLVWWACNSENKGMDAACLSIGFEEHMGNRMDGLCCNEEKCVHVLLQSIEGGGLFNYKATRIG